MGPVSGLSHVFVKLGSNLVLILVSNGSGRWLALQPVRQRMQAA